MSKSIFGDDWFAETHPGYKPKRGRKSKKYSKATVSQAVKSYVKNQIDDNEEFKLIETFQGAQYSYNTGLGTFILLNGVSQGDGQSSRDGRQITNRSLQLKLLARTNSATAEGSNFRFIVFIDLEPHGVAPVATDLLDTVTTSPGLILAHRNLNNRSRFVILKDKTVALPQYDNAGFKMDYHTGIKYRKLKKLKTIFNASNNGNIGDISKGALYVWFFSDNNQGVTHEPLIYVYGRVRFTDA